MNLRRCFVPRQLLFLLAAGLISTGIQSARGQETVVLRNGQTLQATVLGTTPTGVKLQMGSAVMVQPFGNVVSVSHEAAAGI